MSDAAPPEYIQSDDGWDNLILGHGYTPEECLARVRDFLADDGLDIEGMRTEPVWMDPRCCPGWNEDDHFANRMEECSRDEWMSWWTHVPDGFGTAYTRVWWPPPWLWL